MTPKSGKACTLTPPQAPKAATEADTADPGEIAEAKAEAAETGKGKYAPEKVPPPPAVQEEEMSWVGVDLAYDDGGPAEGVRFVAELSDGTTVEGITDDQGRAKVDGVPPGSVKIQFPDIHPDEWFPA